MKVYSVLTLLIIGMCACHSSKESQQSGTHERDTISTEVRHSASAFSADSAYRFVQEQVAYGPRVPNTPGHVQCGDYLYRKLEGYGFRMFDQRAELKAYDGTILHARNIIAVHNPQAKKRILLFAHWDTRHVSDKEPCEEEYHKPVLGADDGGSGTAVLLEVARQLKDSPMKSIGIDIILFDAEDYGVPQDVNYEGNSENTWALGTQYWVRHPHVQGYRPQMGILLDMVGAEGAKFYREYFSQEYAGKQVSMIWQMAQKLGYGKFFVNDVGGGITDDHVFVIKGLGIPCVDIINYDPTTENGFGLHWHTQQDNMDIISKKTLRAVGETLWLVLQTMDKESKEQ